MRPRSTAFKSIESRHVREWNIPNNAMDIATGITNNRRMPVCHHEKTMPRQACNANEHRAAALLGHLLAAHQETIGKIERHCSGKFQNHGINSKAIPLAGQNLGDDAIPLRPKHIYHLHGFNDTEHFATLDLLSDGHVEHFHKSRHRTEQMLPAIPHFRRRHQRL